ncbi:hypothetical protein [Maridesulfovibrio sp.]|uniref:hypothetical protein n=1 Tax=Maridesulfovibrio sp. TaxID=2795000 RepID=UPI003BA98453
MSIFLSILLATIAPTIAISAVNTNLFSNKQIRNSFLLIATIGLLVAISYSLFISYVVLPSLGKITVYSKELSEVITCLSALTIFIFFYEKSFSELLPIKKTRWFIFLGLYLFFTAITWLFTLYPFVAILGLFTVLSVYDLIKNIDCSKLGKPKSIYEKKIKFKHKPNVYVLFLESYHSKEILTDLYGIDSTKHYTKLEKSNFTIYEDVYSNRTTTELSFLSLVWPQLLYHSHHDISDKNGYLPNAFSVFENNGYQINIFSSEHLKSHFPLLFSNLGVSFSEFGHKVEKLFSPILSQNSLFRKVLSTPDLFEHEENFEGRFLSFENQIKTATTPQVQVFHFGACHVRGEAYDVFKKKYTSSYFHAQKKLEQTVSVIKENDSSPLIIAIGDHGARIINEAKEDESNSKTSPNPHGYGIRAKDYSSVFLGIHWPVKHYVGDKEILSHVRIFNHVFAALCEDKIHLENMMPNISLVDTPEYGLTVIVKDGIPLEEWEPAFASRDVDYYIDKIEKDPNNISLHLELVSKYDSENKHDVSLKYLVDLCKKFPRNSKVRIATAIKYNARSESSKAEKYVMEAFNMDCTDNVVLNLLFDIKLANEDVVGFFYFLQKHQDTIPHFHNYTRCGRSIQIYSKTHTIKETLELIESLSPDTQKSVSVGVAKRKVLDFSKEKAHEVDVLINAVQDSSTPIYRRIVVVLLIEAFMFCTTNKDFATSIRIAQAIINSDEKSTGTYIRLATVLERVGRVSDALNVYVGALRVNNSSSLLYHLGLLLIRNNISINGFEQLTEDSQKALARNVTSLIPCINFDLKWYVKEYADILDGMHPFQHYMHHSIGLNLSPNPNFNTTKYVTENTDIFEHGVDPALHYYQTGQYEVRLSPLNDC